MVKLEWDVVFLSGLGAFRDDSGSDKNKKIRMGIASPFWGTAPDPTPFGGLCPSGLERYRLFSPPRYGVSFLLPYDIVLYFSF
jgi:hypothetical protein